MGHTLRRVGDPASNAYQRNRQFLVADIISHLFVAPVQHKRNDIIQINLKTRHGETCRKTHHILLGHAKIKEPIPILILEIIKHPKSGVTANNKDVGICLAGADDGINKSVFADL